MYELNPFSGTRYISWRPEGRAESAGAEEDCGRVYGDFGKVRVVWYARYLIIMLIGCGYSLRKDARAALLTSKRTIDAQSSSQREELFTVVGDEEEKQDSNEEGG